jgi:uncharacterized protein (DUF2141 family)
MPVTRTVRVDKTEVQVTERDPNTAASARLVHTGGVPAQVSTAGTNATPVTTETYLAEVFIPATMTVTGIALMNGDAAAGNITLGLYDANGVFLGKSASTAQSGTDAYQRVALSSALSLPPGTYYVAAQFNNTSARFNTHAFGNFGAGKLTSQTYGTMPGATMPTTFTADLGPIASLY